MRHGLVTTVAAATLWGCTAASGAPSPEGPPNPDPAAAGTPRAVEEGRSAPAPEEVERVPVAEARRRVEAGEALLVCAYDSDERFAGMALDGAISWAELQRRLPALAPSQEIIFYCG